MDEKALTKREEFLNTTVGEYQNSLLRFLGDLGLPQQKVLVDVPQRKTVIDNVPTVLSLIDAEKKKESFYISKFISACGAGLFDAALNYLWDETVMVLRVRVSDFDIEYFLNSTINDSERRKHFSAADDLVKLDDWELIRGCHITGIISDIGFKHLDYIRDLRNWVSAAHPNQNEITGLQLITWLETCIKEVLCKEPSLPAIETKRLLKNIRDEIFSKEDVGPIKDCIDTLPEDILTSLFRTVYGMFCDPDIKTEIKNNIRLLADKLWAILPVQAKRDSGVKYANYAVNGDIERKNLSMEFLESVNGLSFLPEDTLSLEITNATQALLDTHFAFYNFYNEPPLAKQLFHLVPENGEIPGGSRLLYVKTICLCSIGNGYGVSNEAYPYYKKMMNKFKDSEIKIFLRVFDDNDVISRMQFNNCAKNYLSIIKEMKNKTSNKSILRFIDFLEGKTVEQLASLQKATDYKKMRKVL